MLYIISIVFTARIMEIGEQSNNQAVYTWCYQLLSISVHPVPVFYSMETAHESMLQDIIANSLYSLIHKSQIFCIKTLYHSHNCKESALQTLGSRIADRLSASTVRIP